MQAHGFVYDGISQSPEDLELPFTFPNYLIDSTYIMSGDESDVKRVQQKARATKASDLASPDEVQTPEKSPHRHSSGDTAPSSNESVAHVFSPWGAFSPADSVHTSSHSASRGPSSVGSGGLNWLAPTTASFGNLDVENAKKCDRSAMISTGGAMGPLDAQTSTEDKTCAASNQTSALQAPGDESSWYSPEVFDPKDRNFYPFHSGATPEARDQPLNDNSASPFNTPSNSKGLMDSFYGGHSNDNLNISQNDMLLPAPSVNRPGLWSTPPRDSTSIYADTSRESFEGAGDCSSVSSQLQDLYTWATPDRQRSLYQDDARGTTPFTTNKSFSSAALNQNLGNSFSQSPVATLSGTATPEYSIFVGDLCPDLREEDLVNQFLRPPFWPPSHPFAISHASAQQAQGNYSTPAKIAPAPFLSTKSATIMTDPLTGASRGFGFVRFASEADCARALLEMQGVIISPKTGQTGRPLRVCPATPKNRSSSNSSLPTTSALNTIGERVFGAAALPHQLVTQSSLSPLSKTPSSSTSMGSSAFSLLGSTQASVVPPLQAGDNSARQYSASALDPNNTTVFVGGLSSLISEETLKTFFVPFGEIKYVKIPPGKGCGFVQFVRKADAERAIERMQGFPIGGGRIRLSWGRSQGDKAAAAAASAAAQAAQIGHLAGLAGLNPLTTSQLTAVTLANSAGLGGGPDTSALLLRRLNAAAAAAASGREDQALMESIRSTTSDLMMQPGHDLSGVGQPRLAPSALHSGTTTPSHNQMAAWSTGRPSQSSTWPELDRTPPRSQTLTDQQLAHIFGAVSLGDSSGNAHTDSQAAALRERSYTYSLGSGISQSSMGHQSPYYSGSLMLPRAAEQRREEDARSETSLSVLRSRSNHSPAPQRSGALAPVHSSLFQPFSPVPSRVPSTASEETAQGGQGEHGMSSELSFKRYLEQEREKDILRKMQEGRPPPPTNQGASMEEPVDRSEVHSEQGKEC